MNHVSVASRWLEERSVESLELVVPDMAGVPRGKLLPVRQFADGRFKLPFAVFGQTVNGTFFMRSDNVTDRDMVLVPDSSTLRLVPWATVPTASLMMDCCHVDGQIVGVAPRQVLRRVVAKFEEQGWNPIVAPEVEFYLTEEPSDQRDAGRSTELRVPCAGDAPDPYGIDRLHDLGRFFGQLAENCRVQEIAVGAVSQELGLGQFEVNFEHGAPMKLADDVVQFKRTLQRIAKAHGLRATFVAKPDADKPGSSLHIHQSVYDDQNTNLFAKSDSEISELFRCYIGGLQRYLADMLLLFAPYPNSYRRFLSHWSSPVNLEWGVDNRSVGLRVPESEADARRIENRIAGSDVNPYLAIAGTLACGYLGMTRQIECRAPFAGSAYDAPFGLHRHEFEAIDSLRASADVRDVLGDEFVTLYCAVKELECREFVERIPDWERR